jgi:hypothetical protein
VCARPEKMFTSGAGYWAWLAAGRSAAYLSGMNSEAEVGERRLCAECVDEPYLADLIVKHGEAGTCDYCDRDGSTETISQLADRFEAMFQQHYQREGEVDYRWAEPRGESVEFIVGDSGRLPEEAAADIQSVMEDRYFDFDAAAAGDQTDYDSELTYVESHVDDRELQEDWSNLEQEIKSRRRFFSRTAESGFARLFEDVHSLKTRDGRPVVRVIGPDTDVAALFRARAFQSNARFDEALIEPERLVGSPATEHARAGRMNAQGVSVFYGATSEALALAEVRPPVGSRVITGRFDLLRPLTILDVEALEAVLVTGSLFDPSFATQLERAAFFARLARRICMPVMPDDEATDYLVTQAMADFLSDRLVPALDGIAYGSPQSGAEGEFNVALFNPAARVEAAPKPEGDISVHASGDEEIEAYTVWTEIDTSKEPPKPAPVDDFWEFRAEEAPGSLDLRHDTLRLDRESLRVHHVRQTWVETNAVQVRQTVWDVANAPF